MQIQIHHLLLVSSTALGHGVLHDAIPPHPQNGEEIRCLALERGTQWRGAPLPDGIRLWFKHPCPPPLCNLFRASLAPPRLSLPDLYRFQLCPRSVLSSFILPKSNTTGRKGTPTFGKEENPVGCHSSWVLFCFFAWTNNLLEGRTDFKTMKTLLTPTHPAPMRTSETDDTLHKSFFGVGFFFFFAVFPHVN